MEDSLHHIVSQLFAFRVEVGLSGECFSQVYGVIAGIPLWANKS
jgi:hypothetical protein